MNRQPLNIAFLVLAACSSAAETATLTGIDRAEPSGFSSSAPKSGSPADGCTGTGETANCVEAKAPETNGSSAQPAADAGSDASPASSDTTNAQCKAGMECKPGSIRFCDSTVAEWTKSTCDVTGKWGPCEETTAPAGPSCDPDSYSPEKCCPGLKLCCQDETNGPFVDFGSGACAAIACK